MYVALVSVRRKVHRDRPFDEAERPREERTTAVGEKQEGPLPHPVDRQHGGFVRRIAQLDVDRGMDNEAVADLYLFFFREVPLVPGKFHSFPELPRPPATALTGKKSQAISGTSGTHHRSLAFAVFHRPSRAVLCPFRR